MLERQPLLVGGRLGSAITLNGSIPGSVIRMQEGGEALIRVHNRMQESTSIHWHGILLPFTMDGVPGISFEGIGPGETFTYQHAPRGAGARVFDSIERCRGASRRSSPSSRSWRPGASRRPRAA